MIPNPDPPPTLNYARRRTIGAMPDLRTIAQRQRPVIWCIPGYIIAIGLSLVVNAKYDSGRMVFIVDFFTIPMIVTGAVCCFRLLRVLWPGNWYMPILGCLSLVPYIGPILLLMASREATERLRANGITVGLFGARMDQF